MDALLKPFEVLLRLVAKYGYARSLFALALLGVLVVVPAYFGQELLTGGGEAPFYRQEPSLRVVDPPVSLQDGAVDVISVACATKAIPEVNWIIDWLRLSDGRIEDAIFAQILKAPLDTDCTPVPVELDIPRGVRPGMWQLRITVDSGPEQHGYNSQPFEVVP